MFFKKMSTVAKSLRNESKRIAILSKPIVTPFLWVVAITFFPASNFLLMETTTTNFTIFFDVVYFLIILGAFIFSYIRESMYRFFCKNFEKKLERTLIKVYMKEDYGYEEAKDKAVESVRNYTYDSIIDYIQAS